MDILAIVCSTLLLIPVELLIMYLVYSKWILPAIANLVDALPDKIRNFVGPYIDEKLETVTKSLKMSNLRLNRTIKDAAASLDLEDIDLETDEGVEAAKQQLIEKNYPMNVAVSAISKILESYASKKDASKSDKGGNTQW